MNSRRHSFGSFLVEHLRKVAGVWALLGDALCLLVFDWAGHAGLGGLGGAGFVFGSCGFAIGG